MFERLRDHGEWNGSVSADELDQWDANIASAIDGDAGGTWLPSAFIELGGAGLKILAEAALIVQSQPHFSDGILVTAGASQFNDDVTFNDLTTFTERATFDQAAVTALFVTGMACTGPASFGASLTAAGTATLNGPIVANDTLTCHDDFEIVGLLKAEPSASRIDLTTTLRLHGGGNIQQRVGFVLDADAEFGLDDYDIILMLANDTLSADRTWTINNNNAAQGNTMLISRRADTSEHIVKVRNTDGSPICFLGTGSVLPPAATLLWLNGRGWVCLADLAVEPPG